jgi:hypothetical protein
MALGNAISTVQGLLDVWNNTELSFGEKLTTTMTSGASSVLMLVSAFK